MEDRYIVIDTDGRYSLMVRWPSGESRQEFNGSLSEILAYIELRKMGMEIL